MCVLFVDTNKPIYSKPVDIILTVSFLNQFTLKYNVNNNKNNNIKINSVAPNFTKTHGS